MKVVFLEPLGISRESLEAQMQESLKNLKGSEKPEIVYYDDRKTDTETLIKRSRAPTVWCSPISNTAGT